jgi:hypothetical protein
MNNIFKTKEEYEIDQNSSFNKLRKLQITLKEEVALNDIYFENRDYLLEKIETKCYEYFQKRMSIQEIYDHNWQSSKEEDKGKKITYIVSNKPQNELPQCYDPLYKLMFYFRDSNELTLKLIERCPMSNFDQLANFICNYFYVNIFSSTFLNENLLTLLYLLLEKEVDKIQNENKISSFLDYPQSFIAAALRCLSRRDEVKTYLEKILKNLLTRTSGLLRNQSNNMFIGLDVNKIKKLLKDKNYHVERTNKDISSIKNLLTSNINKSKLNSFEKNRIFNTFNFNPQSKELDNIDNIQKNELNKNEVENNIWVQATKETFDDLLIGNDASENNEDIDSNEDNINQRNDNDDLENYFIKSGYFIKKNLEEKKKPHPLLFMQQCMLYDQLDNPQINVHNLTRLYRYDKSKLNIPKFISCFNQVVRHHPCYLTVLHKNGENEYVQIYKPELFKDIQLEKMTEKKFNEDVLPNILTRFQDNFYDSLLINFRVIETENYLYQLMDHHHIFFDAYSIKLLLENLEKLYMDKPLIEDMY